MSNQSIRLRIRLMTSKLAGDTNKWTSSHLYNYTSFISTPSARKDWCWFLKIPVNSQHYHYQAVSFSVNKCRLLYLDQWSGSLHWYTSCIHLKSVNQFNLWKSQQKIISHPAGRHAPNIILNLHCSCRRLCKSWKFQVYANHLTCVCYHPQLRDWYTCACCPSCTITFHWSMIIDQPS